jgi:hypothetical protein
MKENGKSTGGAIFGVSAILILIQKFFCSYLDQSLNHISTNGIICIPSFTTDTGKNRMNE